MYFVFAIPSCAPILCAQHYCVRKPIFGVAHLRLPRALGFRVMGPWRNNVTKEIPDQFAINITLYISFPLLTSREYSFRKLSTSCSSHKIDLVYFQEHNMPAWLANAPVWLHCLTARLHCPSICSPRSLHVSDQMQSLYLE